MPDWKDLLRGYAVFRKDDGSVVFGCVYEDVLVDAHTYPAEVPLEAVYEAFLQVKISEGFVPRGDLTFEIPAGRATNPLDWNAMTWAYIRLFGGGS
jgi:hypothetical protein